MSNHNDPVSFAAGNLSDVTDVDDAKYWASVAQIAAAQAGSSASLAKDYADQAAASAAAAANYVFDTTLNWSMSGIWSFNNRVDINNSILRLDRRNGGGGEMLEVYCDTQAADRNVMKVADNAGTVRYREKLRAAGTDYVQAFANDDGLGEQAILRFRKSGLRQSINGVNFFRVLDEGNDFTPAGDWTFAQPVSGPDPVAQQDYVTKEYYENTGGAGFDPSSDQTITGTWSFIPGLTVAGTLNTGVISAGSPSTFPGIEITAAASVSLTLDDTTSAGEILLQQDGTTFNILDTNAPVTSILSWDAGAGTWNGSHTFSSPLTVQTPTVGGHAANKTYVDGEIASLNIGNYARKDIAQTISGSWTFTASPGVPTPTASNHAARKDYADARETAAKAYTDTEIAAIDFSPYAELAADDTVTGRWTFNDDIRMTAGSASDTSLRFTAGGAGLGAYYDASFGFCFAAGGARAFSIINTQIELLRNTEITDSRLQISRNANSTNRVFLQINDSGTSGGDGMQFRIPSGAGKFEFVPRSGGTAQTARKLSYDTSTQDWTFDTNVNATTFTATSSRTLKENIHPLDRNEHKLMRLEPVVYTRKADKDHTPEIGLILEDVAKVYPEICTTKGIDYSRLAVILLKEVQELKRSIH